MPKIGESHGEEKDADDHHKEGFPVPALKPTSESAVNGGPQEMGLNGSIGRPRHQSMEPMEPEITGH